MIRQPAFTPWNTASQNCGCIVLLMVVGFIMGTVVMGLAWYAIRELGELSW